MATLFPMVGLSGAGKTTRARELAEQHGALRLTPDAWMIPLFGEPEADGRRDVLEGRLIWLALAALRPGGRAWCWTSGSGHATSVRRCGGWRPRREHPAGWCTCQWPGTSSSPGSSAASRWPSLAG